MGDVKQIKLPSQNIYNITDYYLQPVDISSQTINLNDLILTDQDKAIKMYFCNNAINISNKPNSNITAFFLTLKRISYDSSSNYVIQQKLQSKGKTWQRFCTNGTWDSNWTYDIPIATQSADGLMSSTDKTKLDTFGGSYYGTCASTEAANQVKNIIVGNQNFSLQTGTIIGIKFAASNSYSSTAAAPVKFTFNSGTNQYPVYYKNAISPTGTVTAVYGLADYITYYMFDGTKLVWISQDVDNNTDTKVTQSATPTTGTFDLLMAKTAGSHTAETSTSYKSGANLNYDVANKKLKVGGQNVLTVADIVMCTQAEYDAMSTRTGMIYIITEGAPS